MDSAKRWFRSGWECVGQLPMRLVCFGAQELALDVSRGALAQGSEADV